MYATRTYFYLLCRSDQSPFDEVTQTASSGESDNLPIFDCDETV